MTRRFLHSIEPTPGPPLVQPEGPDMAVAESRPPARCLRVPASFGTVRNGEGFLNGNADVGKTMAKSSFHKILLERPARSLIVFGGFGC